jgi:hypothetical protein
MPFRTLVYLPSVRVWCRGYIDFLFFCRDCFVFQGEEHLQDFLVGDLVLLDHEKKVPGSKLLFITTRLNGLRRIVIGLVAFVLRQGNGFIVQGRECLVVCIQEGLADFLGYGVIPACHEKEYIP